MVDARYFDCPVCKEAKKLAEIRNESGHTLGYHCQTCDARFVPETWLDYANMRVVLFGKHENPEVSKVASTTDIDENIRELDKFRKSGKPWFHETYAIETVPIP